MKGPGNSALKIDMKLFSRPLNLLVSTPTRNPRFVNLQSDGEIIVVWKILCHDRFKFYVHSCRTFERLNDADSDSIEMPDTVSNAHVVESDANAVAEKV